MRKIEIDTAEVFDPLLEPARYKGAYGGRGGAKTHFYAGLMVEENVSKRLDNICLREIQKSLKFSVKKAIEMKIEEMDVGKHFEIQDKQIKTKLGGVIVFEGMQNHTADSIKSLEGFDRAWFAEAQKASQTSLDLLRPTIRKEGSELWFDWNPVGAEDPIDQLLRGKNPPPKSIVVETNYPDNPWFPDVLREEMEYDKKRDYDKYLHIWKGHYRKNASARVFKKWAVEEFERPAGTTFRFGADWGFSNDPSTLVRCSIEGNILYIDYEAYMIGCEITDLPDLFDLVPDSRKWFIRADSARPETISFMNNHGFPKMQKAKKGPGSIDEGITFLQSFDIIVHPRCKHTIDELENYSYKVDKYTDEVLPIFEDKNNHIIDPLRYATEGVLKTMRPAQRQQEQPYVATGSWQGM